MLPFPGDRGAHGLRLAREQTFGRLPAVDLAVEAFDALAQHVEGVAFGLVEVAALVERGLNGRLEIGDQVAALGMQCREA